MDHTHGRVPTSPPPDAEERLRAVLDGLRSIRDSDDPHWQPAISDAHAVIDDAWAVIADALSDRPSAASVLAGLRSLVDLDGSLLHECDVAHRLGDVLGRLESAPCTVAELTELAPQLVTDLGFDRAIFSHIVDGVWISQSVFVADNPEWAREINRVGQEQPQPLVPGLFESEIVRRRTAMNVTDVQHESRVHRPIADVSRSTSYVAAPIMAGDRVVAFLHSDRYLQGRITDAVDCEMLAAYAKALQLALSRARAVEHLDSIASVLRVTINQCDDAVAAPREYTLSSEPIEQRVIPVPSRVAQRAVRSIRNVLTARETEILELVAQGRTNAAIAAKLYITEGTVKQHVKHILRKLGAENRVEAVSLLYQTSGA